MSRLWDFIGTAVKTGAQLRGRGASAALSDLISRSTLGTALDALRGRSVLIATNTQLPTALALLELDGVVRRMVLCTPDLTRVQLADVAAEAEADAILVDASSALPVPDSLAAYAVATPAPGSIERRGGVETEWILLTSGTTGAPKLVLHTLQSLAGALPTHPPVGSPTVWSTFYDIRRYGGLQIYLRAVLSGSTLVLSHAGEPTREFLERAARGAVTHMSGTPSHWRSALMSGEAALLHPRYVRLSGEIADQAVLDGLRAVYPDALIAHAFASTEAGVAFDVTDGRAGFPASLIGDPSRPIELKVVDETLRIRSARTAARYLGTTAETLANEEGYVDTGDLVEHGDGRYFFRGRRGGIINVGGLKVYPEEVESVLNADPRVRMSLVRARRSPITGSVVVADVVLADREGTLPPYAPDAVKSDLLAACRRSLAPHKIPAVLRFVPALSLTAAGKLVRPGG